MVEVQLCMLPAKEAQKPRSVKKTMGPARILARETKPRSLSRSVKNLEASKNLEACHSTGVNQNAGSLTDPPCTQNFSYTRCAGNLLR